MLFVAAPAHAQGADPPDQDQTAAAESDRVQRRLRNARQDSQVSPALRRYRFSEQKQFSGNRCTTIRTSRTSAKRGAHIAVGTAITGLFGVQTVTGVWNLVEGWKDPNHKKLRLAHGIMMLGADVGFAAAYATGPGGRNLVNFDQNKSTHRTVVFTTMGVATASYLMMLFGNK